MPGFDSPSRLVRDAVMIAVRRGIIEAP